MATKIGQRLRIILFIIGILLIVLYWQWDDAVSSLDTHKAPAPMDKPKAPIKVIARPIEVSTSDTVFEGVGTGIAETSIQIYSAVPELVTQVLFKPQQKVNVGDLLVQLDDREEKLNIRLAQVKLKVAANLVKRYETAFKEGGVPESELDAIRADYDAAQVTLQQAQLSLEDRQIRAPFTGHVGISDIDPGDRIAIDQPITTLDAREIIQVDFKIPESLAATLSEHVSLPIHIVATTPAWPNKTFDGEITAIDSRLDPNMRTITARASINNSEDFLRPGMSFVIKWSIEGKNYPTVPEVALQWNRDGAFVWIIRDNTAHMVPVRVVARKANKILVEGDLKQDELVVIEGILRLSNDATVELIN